MISGELTAAMITFRTLFAVEEPGMAQMIATQVRMMAEEGKLSEEGLTDLMKSLHAGKGYHMNLYLLETRLRAAGYMPARLTP